MSNQSSFQGQAQLLPLDKLIRAHHIQNLACLNASEKIQYQNGITQLWSKMEEHEAQPNNPERVTVHRRLSELSNNLRARMMKWRADNQQGQQPAPQQPAQQPNQQHQQQAQPQQQPRAPQQGQHPDGQQQIQFSERVKKLARELHVVIPHQLRNRTPDELQRYINGEKRKYATALHRFEVAQRDLENYKTQATDRNKTKPFTQPEKDKVTQIIQRLQATSEEARRFFITFKKQAEEGPQGQPQPQPQQVQAQVQQPQQSNQASQQQQQKQQPQPQQQQSQQNQQQTQQSQQEPQEAVPQIKQEQPQRPQIPKQEPVDTKSQLDTTTPANVTQQAQQQPTQIQAPQIQQTPTSATKPPTPSSATQPTAPNSGGAQAPPQPLSHQMALDRAAQYQNNQQPPHGHPAQGSQPQPIAREGGSTSASAPPIKHQHRPLNVPPPQPVSLAPARPTLAGGQGPVGAMGQPGIQKPPAFSLEGDTDRVLSKKKLDDLVRQVTGVAGGEGAESLDPDVEETLLDVADEFVDNVIMQACRLAKLRSSAQLELRDIQLILERNYNIRVPGFASDELRTVKKIQPTQAWTQKMSAVQAAKVTGGKADL